jgi:hypothetical protein
VPSFRQNISFARGEIAPSLHARVDLADYAMGLATCRNFLIERQGGAANRPGTSFVCEVKDSSAATRLFTFIFNTSQTYALEFGNLYMRVVKNGAQVRETGLVITGISQASPGRVTTSGAHNYSTGQEVYLSAVAGMVDVNGRNFKIVVFDATNFDLYEMDGVTAFNTSHFTAYASGGATARVYEIATPYTTTDLTTLDAKAQSADTIIIVHPTYPPRKLARSADTTWTLTTIVFDPTQARPSGGTGTGTAGGGNFRYRVTAINKDTSEESLPGYGATQVISNITQANPAVVTYVGADNFINGDEVFITAVVGMTQVNDLTFTVANLNAGANTFELQGINSTGYTAYSSGGTVAQTYIKVYGVNAPNVNSIALTIPVTANASEYNYYRRERPDGTPVIPLTSTDIYGFIGISGPSFTDNGIAKDDFDTPPRSRGKFAVAGDYPGTATFYQQRLILAGSTNNPATFDASRIGLFFNYTASSPIQDDDAIMATLAGRSVNRILFALDIGTLVMFTAGGEWAILGGGQDGTLTPFDINARQYGYNGIGTLRPLVVNRTAIYVQARGNKVRDLLYDFQSNGYSGVELSLKSAHLLDGYSITDWDYQLNPHSIVWAVRSDGTLLGITYVREQEVIAWHRHDTDGTFENVAVIPEGGEDAPYFIVRRTVTDPNTQVAFTKRYIERMDSRQWTSVVDAKHLDCALAYDGRNPTPSNTVFLFTTGGWTQTDTQFATFKGSIDSSKIGSKLFVTDSTGAVVKFTILATAAPPLTFTIQPDRTVPAAMRNVDIANWSYAVNAVSGLWHLEGKAVGIFADGFVVGSPKNPDVATYTVTNGALSLPDFFAVIRVGLPYLSDLGTLDIDRMPGTLANKAKLVVGYDIWVQATRGLWVGQTLPADSAATTGLVEHKPRTAGYINPPELLTEVVEQAILGSWSTTGRGCIRIIDPVPARVLAIAPGGLVNQ